MEILVFKSWNVLYWMNSSWTACLRESIKDLWST